MPSVLRKIFAKAGVTKNELRDRKTRAFIMNTLEVRATIQTASACSNGGHLRRDE